MSPKSKTETVDFDIYLPGTPEKAPEFVETIQVEVYQSCGESMLTTESSKLIERTRARHMGLLHGSDIKTLRLQLGLSQDQFSALLECGKKSLSRWENGRGFPSGIVNKLLRLLEDGAITVDDLRHASGPRLACSDDLTFYHHRSIKAITSQHFTSALTAPRTAGDLRRYVDLASNS